MLPHPPREVPLHWPKCHCRFSSVHTARSALQATITPGHWESRPYRTLLSSHRIKFLPLLVQVILQMGDLPRLCCDGVYHRTPAGRGSLQRESCLLFLQTRISGEGVADSRESPAEFACCDLLASSAASWLPRGGPQETRGGDGPSVVERSDPFMGPGHNEMRKPFKVVT